MANKSEKWESVLQSHMRKEEAPLPLKYLSEGQIRLLSKFIAAHRDEITLPTEEQINLLSKFIVFQSGEKSLPIDELTDELREIYYCNYNELCILLRILQENSVLKIIDNYSSNYVIKRIRKLRMFNFRGSWFDSLQSIIVDNIKNNGRELKKLESQAPYEKLIYDNACQRLKALRAITDLTGEQADMMKCCEQQKIKYETELATIMEKKKVICDARDSLNFFYPII